jgi:hypothetical protein
MNLTPKSIIISALQSKLKGTGIDRITLVFPVETEKYNLMVSNSDGSNMSINLEQNEMNTIKKIFVNRIIHAWNRKYKQEIKDVIVQIDIIKEDFDVFIQDNKNIVHKFEY